MRFEIRYAFHPKPLGIIILQYTGLEKQWIETQMLSLSKP